MKIVELRPGQKARVKEIKKGVNGQRRLFEIGLIPGTELKLLSSHPFNGPLVLQVGNAKIALGRGMAEAVEVELLE
ncbi:ferrous iron transport protein A [Thermosyntropha lipolytica DSM 11003]|uniref:Ferrous iron transport protein A n=1 Tax=Thermosyntropha lipolytica DSM 11003 TaxID=1123382 RepID=A0A1M5ND01_9FIRM|nr:FeoA family protein [Thermosyntropha lipolytica]SHG87390.1 ferrous iron transport protein A [Thermosyntropha lipolytica DSM 11003]